MCVLINQLSALHKAYIKRIIFFVLQLTLNLIIKNYNYKNYIKFLFDLRIGELPKLLKSVNMYSHLCYYYTGL